MINRYICLSRYLKFQPVSIMTKQKEKEMIKKLYVLRAVKRRIKKKVPSTYLLLNVANLSHCGPFTNQLHPSSFCGGRATFDYQKGHSSVHGTQVQRSHTGPDVVIGKTSWQDCRKLVGYNLFYPASKQKYKYMPLKTLSGRVQFLSGSFQTDAEFRELSQSPSEILIRLFLKVFQHCFSAMRTRFSAMLQKKRNT